MLKGQTCFLEGLKGISCTAQICIIIRQCKVRMFDQGQFIVKVRDQGQTCILKGLEGLSSNCKIDHHYEAMCLIQLQTTSPQQLSSVFSLNNMERFFKKNDRCSFTKRTRCDTYKTKSAQVKVTKEIAHNSCLPNNSCMREFWYKLAGMFTTWRRCVSYMCQGQGHYLKLCPLLLTLNISYLHERILK